MRVHQRMVGIELLRAVSGWGDMRRRIGEMVRCGYVSDWAGDGGPWQLLGLPSRDILDRAGSVVVGWMRAVRDGDVSVFGRGEQCQLLRCLWCGDFPDGAGDG